MDRRWHRGFPGSLTHVICKHAVLLLVINESPRQSFLRDKQRLLLLEAVLNIDNLALGSHLGRSHTLQLFLKFLDLVVERFVLRSCKRVHNERRRLHSDCAQET